MTFALLEASSADRADLRRLIELYRYDFTEFDPADIGPHGDFGYRYLDLGPPDNELWRLRTGWL